MVIFHSYVSLPEGKINAFYAVLHVFQNELLYGLRSTPHLSLWKSLMTGWFGGTPILGTSDFELK